MPLDVERSDLESGVVLLALTGSLTMGNQLMKLEWLVEELIKEEHNRIVLEMSGITYLDSSSIGVLVGCNGKIAASGGQLRLAAVTARVAAVLSLSKIDTVLSINPTQGDAVSALASKT